MREIEIDKMSKRYKISKPISKKTLYIGYILTFALFLFAIFTHNHGLIWLFLTLLSMIMNYHIDMMTIRVNVAPHLFSSLLITRTMGLGNAISMLVISTLFVHFYTGRLDKDTLLGFIMYIAINFAMTFLPGVNFVLLGIVLVTVKFLVSLVVNIMLNVSPQELLFEHFLGFLSNVLLFLIFGDVAVKSFN